MSNSIGLNLCLVSFFIILYIHVKKLYVTAIIKY